jgi:hypothetical protein
MSSPKVIIPEPCNKGWDNMTPHSSGPITIGRHCDTCDKVVVDFTQMNKEEIKTYFIEKAGTKICGHFKVSQVEPYRPKFHRKLITLYNYIEQKISIRVFKRISLAGVAACMFLVGCQNKPEVEGEIENKSCDKNTQSLTGDTVIYNESTIDGGISPMPDSTIEKQTKITKPKVNHDLKGETKIVDEPTVDGDMTIE